MRRNVRVLAVVAWFAVAAGCSAPTAPEWPTAGETTAALATRFGYEFESRSALGGSGPYHHAEGRSWNLQIRGLDDDPATITALLGPTAEAGLVLENLLEVVAPDVRPVARELFDAERENGVFRASRTWRITGGEVLYRGNDEGSLGLVIRPDEASTPSP